jgi:hypothetical protein
MTFVRKTYAYNVDEIDPCRAFLLRQKSTGEEVVVMMTPIKASGVTSKTVVSRIPAYVSTSGKISTPPRKKARLF